VKNRARELKELIRWYNDAGKLNWQEFDSSIVTLANRWIIPLVAVEFVSLHTVKK